MSPLDESQLTLGLADLAPFERGSVSFRIGAGGEIVYTGTVATVRMHDDEGLLAFWVRLRRDYGLRPDDTVTLLNNGGRLDTARIERSARMIAVGG